MKKIFILSLVLSLISVMSYAIPNALTGQLSDYSGFSVAINHSLGADTNGNEGFGATAYSSEVYGYDDPSTLYVFVQGGLTSGNKVWILIDSDDNAATGFSGAPPAGTYGETGAIQDFSQIDNGGWDTFVEFTGNGTVSDINCVIVTYFSFSTTTVQSETYMGDTDVITNSGFTGTIRGSSGMLQFGYNNGDGVGQGLDFAIPRGWLGSFTGNPNYRLAVLNGNGTGGSGGSGEYWSNSFIPALPSGTGNLGTASIGGLTNLAGLTAPVFAYQVENGVPVELSKFSAE
jgi:hypothetical protein